LGGNEYTAGQILLPVKPTTTVRFVRSFKYFCTGSGAASKNARAAVPVSIISFAARWRTPSGSPLPHTRSGRIALWRSSIESHTAWPTRWFEIANEARPQSASSSHFFAQ
jgi:penicillin V acylase-like amidase (Ntn superfamily)